MKRAALSTIGGVALTALVAACGSTPAKVITATDSDVAVSISEDGAKDLDNSLAAAGQMATKECSKFKKVAKFDHTENVAKGLVAHFDCVIEAKPSS
jgi:hypothetical protein